MPEEIMRPAEIIIDSSCGISKFYAIANTLAEKLKVKFRNQINEVEETSWDFEYKEKEFTLHYNLFIGVTIFPLKTKDSVNQDVVNIISGIVNLLHSN